MRQKEFLFKREKERKIKPSKTEHERPYLVLVMVKLNGQIGLPSKNICMDSVQSHSCVWLFATPWTAARQASLPITNSRSLLKLMSFELVISSNHLILCCPLLLPASIFPSIKVFSNESVLHIRWPKHWSFSFNISPSNEYSGLISFRMGLVGSPCSPRDSQESPPTPQFRRMNSLMFSFFL